MIKTILTSLLTLTVFCNSYAQGLIIQSQLNGNSLTVKGYAELKIKPDIAKLNITITKKDTSSEKSLMLLNIEFKKVKDLFSLLQVDTTNIRISDFGLESEFDDEVQRKFYNSKSSLTLKFPYDPKVISNMIKGFQEKKITDIDFNFEYELSDNLEQVIADSLAILSIRNAKLTANKTCNELGLKIMDIRNVSKSSYEIMQSEFAPPLKPQVKFTPPVIKRSEEIFNSFEVEEITRSEEIMITYEIERK